MARTPRAPWKRPNPRTRAGRATKHLTPAKKVAAEARAWRAGRRYPNLVDNVRAASRKKASKGQSNNTQNRRVGRKRAAYKTTAGKPTTRVAKKTSKKASNKPPLRRPAKPREKDPQGGLTAAIWGRF